MNQLSPPIRFALFGISALFAVGLVWLLLMASPLGRTSVSIDLDSSVSGFSQVFFAEPGSDFAEEASVWQPLSTGESTLRFPFSAFRETLGDRFRWDPADAPGTFTVRGIALDAPFRHEALPLDSLKGQLDIASITPGEVGTVIVTGSNDGQAVMAADLSGFAAGQARLVLWISIGLVATIGAATVLLRRFRPAKKRGRPAYATEYRPTRIDLLGVPTWATVVFSGGLAVGIALLLIGGQRVGISMDEPFHVDRLQSFFASGIFIAKQLFTDGVPMFNDAYVYGPVTSLAEHAGAVLLGAEEFLKPVKTAESFAARHLVNALIAIVGLASAAAIGRLLFGGWRWAIVTAGVLAVIPSWTGDGMFNVKDIPVATGFTMFTLALVLLISPDSISRRWMMLATVAMLAGGIALSLGTRPGIWMSFAASALIVLAISGAVDMRVLGATTGLRHLAGRSATLAVGIGIGYALLLLVYPYAFAQPLEMLAQSAQSSADYQWSGSTLTAGIPMPENPPWFYLPIWIGARLPVIVLVLAVVALVAFAYKLGRVVRTREHTGDTALAVTLVPVAAQAMLTPIAAIALGSTLYQGIRQVIFIVPPIAILAVAGVWFAIHAGQSRPWMAHATWGALVLSVVATVVAQVQLFPYTYAYLNPIAASGAVDRNWNLDYYWLTARELTQLAPDAERISCSARRIGNLEDCWSRGVFAPYWEGRDTGDRPLPLRDDQYIVLEQQNGRAIHEAACRAQAAVTRSLFWQQVTLSSALLCDVATGALPPSDTISFSSVDLNTDPYLLWGWNGPDENGIWSKGGSASLGFTLPERLRGRDLVLTITGSRYLPPDERRSLDIRVNSVPVGGAASPADATPGPIAVRVPRNVVDALPDGRMVVRLGTPDPVVPLDRGLASDDRSLGFFLESLSVAPAQ